MWIGVCFKQMPVEPCQVTGKTWNKQLPASFSHYLLASLRNNPHSIEEIVPMRVKALLCLWPSKPRDWICNRSVWAPSIKTVEVKLHEERLKIDHFLFFVSILLSLCFLWLTAPFCLQLLCVCHKSAPDLDLCTGCSKGLWAHRAVIYAPYFVPCSVKEVARHGSVVTSLLWWCLADVA